VGGSIAAAWDLFMGETQKVLGCHLYAPADVEVVPSALGPVAGAVGAGLLAGRAGARG
jgi:hypothetical protein